jgi:hypothetical protein
MKTSCCSFRSLRVDTLLLLAVLACILVTSARAAYRTGDVVTNNFSFTNRLRWTNDNGQIFTPSNTVVRLSDFEGKIVFFCFFDVW